MVKHPLTRTIRSATDRGFTLVEMIVVIGVVTILIGILVPSLTVFRAESNSTSCLSNLRQFHLAIESYRQINQGLLPFALPLPAASDEGPEGGLNEVLSGYIEPDCDCWLCAADLEADSLETGTSYLYLPGLLMLSPQVQMQLPPLSDPSTSPMMRMQLASRPVTKLLDDDGGRTLPVLLDSQDRHDYGTRQPRNGLYIDGSARILTEPVETE